METPSAPLEIPHPPARPWVKICGLSQHDHVEQVIAYKGDAVGFVHFEQSPRHLPIGRMADLVAGVDGRCQTIVVTVDPSDELLDDIVLRVAPSAIQLHGTETPARVSEVIARTGLPVVKALQVGDGRFAEAFLRYGSSGARLLLDAKAPKGSALPGGNGVPFDWNLLQRLEGVSSAGFVLSGGLNAGNVAEAIRIARPHGIDVSSGVEAAPGEKSAALLHSFFDALDAAMSSQAERHVP